MSRCDYSSTVISDMAKDELQKLQDILMEHVRLVNEINRADISVEERKNIQKRIKHLVRKRDYMVNGDEI